MANTPPPSGYISKAVPKSAVEAVSMHSADRVKSIAKSALQGYIASFLDTTGANRSLIEATSKQGLQYITDKTFDETKDPTKRATQLARFYSEMREKVPAILIVDAGVFWENPGLGTINNSRYRTGSDGKRKFVSEYKLIARVPVTVISVTADEDSTNTLQAILLMMFQQFKNLAGGSEITSRKPDDNWVVRLPLNPVAGNNEGRNITEDLANQLWAAPIDLELAFEDTILLEQDFVSFKEEVPAFNVDNPDLAASLPPIITAPTSVQLNSQVSFSVNYLDPIHHKIISNNPRVAILDLDRLVIIPRRPGTFSLQVIDLGKRQQVAALMAPTVAASLTIDVVL